ncbi:MAG: ABC transporter substrate-binding protein [Micromonosporaceae bacterium]|nr:ABC transporter substrate-binding protein [Micromonosporaceae bacterium]
MVRVAADPRRCGEHVPGARRARRRRGGRGRGWGDRADPPAERGPARRPAAGTARAAGPAEGRHRREEGTSVRTQRIAVIVAAAATLLAGCGQHPGVHDKLAGGGNGLQPGVDGGTGDGTGDDGTGADGTGTGSGTGSGSGSSGSSGGGPGDTTGVTKDTITIGIHAPLTGAAPIKQTSFDKGKDLYWKYGDNGKPITIYGRKVKVVFNDDTYKPSRARQVCQQMAERDKAFLLVGGGGADQIQACAQYSASKGIPYLSAGVQETGLRGLKNYFAASRTYPSQVSLLADYARKQFSVSKSSEIAAVITNTPNFDDAARAFSKEFPGAKVHRPDKNANGGSMANNLCDGPAKKYKVVFPLTAPTYYLQMAPGAACRPQYLGIGVTMGLDTVASVGCETRSTEGARFFSPAPAYHNSNQYDPQFRKAANAAGVSDDITWLLWGQSKVLHHLLLRAGKNLNRQRFITTSETATKVRTNVFPELAYSPSNHFGARQVSVLNNVCSRRGSAAGYYVTEKAFVSSY